MELFSIDSQSNTIFVNVENGVVMNCANGGTPKFDAKMNEVYGGKTISFLKEDFEARMKPVYFNVRSTALIHFSQSIAMINYKMSTVSSLIDSTTTGDERKVLLRITRDEMIKEIEELESKLVAERLRMVAEHGYNYKF